VAPSLSAVPPRGPEQWQTRHRRANLSQARTGPSSRPTGFLLGWGHLLNADGQRVDAVRKRQPIS
jgi:hypothetical protein